MDCDSFVLRLKTEDIIKDIKKLEDIFDFSNLDKDYELFSNKNKKVNGKFKTKTPTNIWMKECIAMRSKCYAFKCGDDSKKQIETYF